MAEARGSISENMHLSLFDEVSGICPKCSKSLLKRQNGRLSKLYEVAHIYPHSPRPDEITLLKNELKLTNDVDDIGNLIALCRECHKIFDNPRTLSGYREMCEIKKEAILNVGIKNGFTKFHLTEELKEIVESLSKLQTKSISDQTLNAKTVDSKLSGNNNYMFQVKIEGYVNYFYFSIRDLFKQVDQLRPGTSELIGSEIRTHFLKLKRDGVGPEKIFDSLVEWIRLYYNGASREASEALISFFVQNCEVYS